MVIAFSLFPFGILYAQPVHRSIRTPEYKALQKKLCTGWNTWYNNSVTTYVLLPECFSINLCLTQPGSPDYLKNIFKRSDYQKQPYKVDLGLRSYDGSYTSMALKYKGEEVSIQTATDGDDELILVSPVQGPGNYLAVEAGLLWNQAGMIGMENDQLIGKIPGRTIRVSTTTSSIMDAYTVTTAPRLTFSLKHAIGIYTGRYRTLEEIKAIIGKHR